MKRSLVLTTLLASGLALGAAAQTAPTPAAPAASAAPAGPAKIAVIAFQVAVAKTNEGQRNFADLQKKFQPRENALKERNDEVETLTKQLQAQGATLSEAARASQARTIDEKKKKLDRDLEDLRNEGGQEAQQMYNTLASKVYDVLSSYAQQQGYTLVLDFSQQQNPILFAVDSTNITNQVVEAYNVKSGVPAPPPPPAGSSAPSAPKPTPKPPVTH
ncbi:MAG TPA: OmpH family outer membrane protein [Terracidiphilus sp.]|jgi:outer membrane protein|nr:OmpH family outer membrane protein [Terracidiphilus sp.]